MKIDELEQKLKQIDWPERMKLGPFIVKPSKMINSHLKILKSNPGNPAYLPYYNHLIELYENRNCKS